MPDGTFVCISVYALSPALVVDINGDKKPNKLGYDVFAFFYGTYDMGPYTDKIYNRFRPNSRTGCSRNDKGMYGEGCAWKIMQNNWKIPDNYPW